MKGRGLNFHGPPAILVKGAAIARRCFAGSGSSRSSGNASEMTKRARGRVSKPRCYSMISCNAGNMAGSAMTPDRAYVCTGYGAQVMPDA